MNRQEILERAKPILFNTEMVRAILEGRKTVTRRVVKFKDGKNPNWTGYIKDRVTLYNGTNEPCNKRCPYQPGDILYVRETWAINTRPNMYGNYYYRANRNAVAPEETKWRPSIHMPKEAARILLRVLDVRAERLQEITEEQAEKEGMPDSLSYPINPIYCPICHGNGIVGGYNPETLGFEDKDCPDCNTSVKRFRNLWNSTIKKSDIDRYGWDANPFVWVIEFERVGVE